MNVINIALDCMGGDSGIKATVPAAVKFSRERADVNILLVGDAQKIGRRLSRHKFDRDRIEVIQADEVIEMDEAPAQALRYKKNSSMRISINLIKEGRAHACVSAAFRGATRRRAGPHWTWVQSISLAGWFRPRNIRGVARDSAHLFQHPRPVWLLLDRTAWGKLGHEHAVGDVLASVG